MRSRDVSWPPQRLFGSQATSAVVLSSCAISCADSETISSPANVQQRHLASVCPIRASVASTHSEVTKQFAASAIAIYYCYYPARKLILMLPFDGGWKAESTYAVWSGCAPLWPVASSGSDVRGHTTTWNFLSHITCTSHDWTTVAVVEE